MQRHPVVCVPCRNVQRRKWYESEPRCQFCRGLMENISYKMRFPAKNNDKGWQEIEKGNWLWENASKNKYHGESILQKIRRSNPKERKSHLTDA